MDDLTPDWLKYDTRYLLGQVLSKLDEQGKALMAVNEDLTALSAQVDKIYTEVSGLSAEIAALEQKLVDQGVDPVVLDSLKAKVQAVDDLIPDQPPTP